MVARRFQASTYSGFTLTIELSRLIARSRSLASIAVLARVISRLAVSLRDSVHTAQMRSSIALAVASSGATFKAPNRKSRLRNRSPRAACGSLTGGSTHLPLSATAEPAQVVAANAAVNNSERNRARMGGV